MIGFVTAGMAGVVINISCQIGEVCIIKTSSSICHDNFIENYVHIFPGVRTAHTVKISKSTWIGIGSVVSNNLNICSGCKVGAGDVVIKDITEPRHMWGFRLGELIYEDFIFNSGN